MGKKFRVDHTFQNFYLHVCIYISLATSLGVEQAYVYALPQGNWPLINELVHCYNISCYDNNQSIIIVV